MNQIFRKVNKVCSYSILFVILAVFTSCVFKDDVNLNQDNSSHISNHFVSFSDINYVNNIVGNNAILDMKFKPQELISLQDKKLHIKLNVVSGASKIHFNSESATDFIINKDEIKDNHLLISVDPTGILGGSGKVEIQANINNIAQSDVAKFIVAKREITEIKTIPSIYNKIGDHGDLILKISSDIIDDEFTVDITGQDVDKFSSSTCKYSNASGGGIECSHNSFVITGIKPLISATIHDTNIVKTINLVFCDKPGIYFIDKDALKEISLIMPATIKLGRCMENMDSEITGVLSFSNYNAQYKKILDAKNGISIDDIIGVSGSANNSFKFSKNQQVIEFKVSKKSDDVTLSDFQFFLNRKIEVVATDSSKLYKDETYITNTDAKVATINFPNNMNANPGSSNNFVIERTNIDADAKISVDMYDGETKINDLAKLSVIGNTLHVEVNSNLPPKIYSLRAYFTENSDISISITGNSTINVIEELAHFNLSPVIKHVLSRFPSFYFLDIEAQKTASYLNNSQLYLSGSDKDHGCDQLIVTAVDANTAQVGKQCKLNTTQQLEDNTCSCVLNDNGEPKDKKCIFKIQLPNSYKTEGTHCKVIVGTKEHVNLGSAEIQSVAGLNPIPLQALSKGQFNTTSKLELFSRYSDDDSQLRAEPLNYRTWVTQLSKANIDNNDLFQDNILTEIHSTYFSSDGGTFYIKNFPGANMTETVLPRTYFIMGLSTMDWAVDRCSGSSSLQPQLGCIDWNCNSTTFQCNNRKGEAYVPENSVKISNNVISIMGNKINIVPGWSANCGNNCPRLLNYPNISSNDNKVLSFDILYDFPP